MNATIRQKLAQVTQDVRIREIVTFLYRDHPQGATFEGLKEMLCLHEDFEEASLKQLIEEQVLGFDGTRYKLTGTTRQILDRDPVILMDEFLH